MDSALRICLRKSSRAESSSAESLLNAEARRLKRENRAEPCFFRALGKQVQLCYQGLQTLEHQRSQNEGKQEE